MIAVAWQVGSLKVLGYGLNPYSMLIPFLVFAIGVSHGVQMVSAYGSEVYEGADSVTAARSTFRRLLVPGGIALLSDTIGFITIMLIKIRMIQEMAITASLGVGAIILTNLVLVPVLVSYTHFDAAGNDMAGNVYTNPYSHDSSYGSDDDDGNPVPEPGTLSLLGMGLLGLIPVIRRKKNSVE